MTSPQRAWSDRGESLDDLDTTTEVNLRFSPTALKVRQASVDLWGPDRAVEIVGRSPQMQDLLTRLEKVAPFEEPVLIFGESGVGKELLAQAIYLLSPLTSAPFVPVNCPQYLEGNLTVSELFGHKKGSFTGAESDRKGCFETANGGVIFLDEVGDLHMSAQVMLLRSLATGEFQPLGSETTRRVHVRVVAATNRSLNQLAANREFRRDLMFRLRYYMIEVPPLRERGDDWYTLLSHFLNEKHRYYGVRKRFSEASLRLLENYPWPGNVRELLTITTTGYALSDGDVIEPRDFEHQFEHDGPLEGGDPIEDLVRQLERGGGFWDLVHGPFIERDLNRRQVRQVIAKGLDRADNSYRDLLDLWEIPGRHYQRFMDFLRHHRLKPSNAEADEA